MEPKEETTQQDFNIIFLEVIDETFSYSLGEKATTVVYSHLEHKFNLKKQQIPNQINVFTKALQGIFGSGSAVLEALLMKKLHERVNVSCQTDKVDDLTFPKYVGMVKQSLSSKNDVAKTGQVLDKTQCEKTNETNNFISLLNFIADPVVVVDARGHFLLVNIAFEEHTGLSGKDVIGTSFLELKILEAKSKALLLENLRKRHQGLPVEPYEIAVTIYKNKSAATGYYEINAKQITFAGQPADLVVFRDITRRKKNELKLKEYTEKLEWLVDKRAKEIIENEAKLSGIFESSPDAIFVLDPKGTIVECNQAALKMSGCSLKADLIGKNGFAFVDKKSRQKVLSLVQEQLAYEDAVGNIEFTFLTKDGRKINSELSLSVVKDSSGKPVNTIVITKDITQRKELEDDLRSSEERFRAISTFASDAIVLLDKKAKIIYWNNAAEKIFGYTKEEAVGKKLSTLVVPQRYRRAHLELIAKILGNKPQVSENSLEVHALRKDGTEFPIELTVSAFKLRDVPCVLEIIRDVSERKKMEDTLKQERNMLESVTENIGAGLTIISRDYRLLWTNKFIKQRFDGVENKKCYEVYAGLNAICAGCGPKKIFEGAASDSREYCDAATAKDGKPPLWFEIITTPIKDGHGNVIAALELSVNITEKKLLRDKLAEYSQKLEHLVDERTKELKQTQAKLVKSERLAAIGELAGMVGHDLRNPLTSIKGAAYLLKTRHSSGLSVAGKDLLSTIDISIDYSNKIINDLLDYSRDIKLEFSKTTPKLLLKNALSLIVIPEKINITNSSGDTPVLYVDTGKLSRVFVNLIKNAIDAMPEGGTLTITSRAKKDTVEFVFEDTGVGMDEETLNKLWIPLFTTKAKGMGFGLSICQRIVKAHCGKITVESTVGKGTRFAVAFPVNPKPQATTDGPPVIINYPAQVAAPKPQQSREGNP